MAGPLEKYSANEKMKEAQVSNETDADSKQAAEDAGVYLPSYINYEEALNNYSARSDIESVGAYRSRTYGFEGDGFEGQKWARTTTPDDEPQDGGATEGGDTGGTTGG